MSPDTHLIPRVAGVVLAAAALAAAGGPALAGNACSGTYMTSVMQPIALPVTVGMADAPENPGMAEHFAAGLRAGGAQIDPSSPLKLGLLFTLSTRGAGPLQGTSYNNFTWADEGGHLADINAAKLNITANVVDRVSAAYVWIASVECTVKTRDGGALAAELGELIGRTLGRSVPDGRL